MPPHDTLWKTLLQLLFASFLRFAAPELSVGTLSFLDKELFPEGFRGEPREVDVLARVSLPDGRTVLVHVEVEARHQKSSVTRLRRYYHLLEARYGEPVFSLLLALTRGPRGVSQERQEETIAGQPRLFAYTAIGLAGLDAEALLASPEPIAWAFAALARCRKSERPARKLACLRRIALARLPAAEELALFNAVETYLQLSAEQASVYERLKRREKERIVRKSEMTWADRIEAEGARRMLKHLLQSRFGELPAAVVEKIDGIPSIARLTRLAEKVLVAGSLAEMGLTRLAR